MEGGVEQEAVQFESESVHKVYNAIAPHFSNTRYKVLRYRPDICSNLLKLALAFGGKIHTGATSRFAGC